MPSYLVGQCAQRDSERRPNSCLQNDTPVDRGRCGRRYGLRGLPAVDCAQPDNKKSHLQVLYGSDGTRTRDLRRDRKGQQVATTC